MKRLKAILAGFFMSVFFPSFAFAQTTTPAPTLEVRCGLIHYEVSQHYYRAWDVNSNGVIECNEAGGRAWKRMKRNIAELEKFEAEAEKLRHAPDVREAEKLARKVEKLAERLPEPAADAARSLAREVVESLPIVEVIVEGQPVSGPVAVPALMEPAAVVLAAVPALPASLAAPVVAPEPSTDIAVAVGLQRQLSDLECQISDLQRELDSRPTKADLAATVRPLKNQLAVLKRELAARPTQAQLQQSVKAGVQAAIVPLNKQLAGLTTEINALRGLIEDANTRSWTAEERANEAEDWNQWLILALVILGILGPIGGFFLGRRGRRDNNHGVIGQPVSAAPLAPQFTRDDLEAVLQPLHRQLRELRTALDSRPTRKELDALRLELATTRQAAEANVSGQLQQAAAEAMPAVVSAALGSLASQFRQLERAITEQATTPTELRETIVSSMEPLRVELVCLSEAIGKLPTEADLRQSIVHMAGHVRALEHQLKGVLTPRKVEELLGEMKVDLRQLVDWQTDLHGAGTTPVREDLGVAVDGIGWEPHGGTSAFVPSPAETETFSNSQPEPDSGRPGKNFSEPRSRRTTTRPRVVVTGNGGLDKPPPTD